MNDVIFNSRTADKFVVRLPDGLRDEVDAIAVEQSTSMNSIFIRSVRQFMAGQRRQDLLLDALEQRLAMIDADLVNQTQAQNIPKVIPANWSDAQVLDFCSVAFRHVVVEGDLKFSDINDALRYMADKGEPAFLREFDMDERIKQTAAELDPRNVFAKLNPIGATADELEQGRNGFVDERTHADYLIFLAGFQAALGVEQ